MYSPSDRFVRHPDLKLRAMPEWEQLLVYTPHRPAMHQLNAEAWLVFELADGRTYREVVTDYRQVASGSVPDRDVQAIVDRTLAFLEHKGMVSRELTGDQVPAP